MIVEQDNRNCYQVLVYDWIELHGDYLCGHIKRQPSAEEGSDLRYWMFYPIGGIKPLMVGDLMSIYKFMSGLNTEE